MWVIYSHEIKFAVGANFIIEYIMIWELVIYEEMGHLANGEKTASVMITAGIQDTWMGE